jgi:uncharacterized protein
MFRIFRILFLLAIAIPLSAQSGKVYTVQTVPDPKRSGGGYVSDPDGFLTPAEVAELNQRIAAIEDSTSAQIAVVLLGSIGEDNPKEFATLLFSKWGIGRADRDNGLLIISIMDQRRTEFETGYGMEAVLPDAYCYRIGMQELVPHYREGQYGKGLINTVKRIGELLQDPKALEDILSSSSEGRPRGLSASPLGVPLPLWILGFFNFIFLSALTLRVVWVLRNKDDLYDKFLAIRPWTSLFYLFLAPPLYLLAYGGLKALLNRLRNQPRFSRETGKPMHKLNEEEEDLFLERGQITEEEIGSVDYDVWVTDDADDVLILRYARRFSKYHDCPQCKFKAYYMSHTATITRATYTSSGLREITHLCKNCGYRHTAHQVIPQLTRSSSGGSSGGGGGGSWGGGRSGGGGGGVSW